MRKSVYVFGNVEANGTAFEDGKVWVVGSVNKRGRAPVGVQGHVLGGLLGVGG